jgi:hypothetical protein
MKIIIFAFVVLFSHFSFAENNCEYNLSISSVRINTSLPRQKNLRILVDIRVNTLNVFDINELLISPPEGFLNGVTYSLNNSKEVPIKVLQLDEMRAHFPFALTGLNILVELENKKASRAFVEWISNLPKHLFLAAWGESIVFQNPNYLNNFDPRRMKYSPLGESFFSAPAENLDLNFRIRKNCQP